MITTNTMPTAISFCVPTSGVECSPDTGHNKGSEVMSAVTTERQLTIAIIGAFLVESVSQSIRAKAFEKFGAYELVRELAQYAVYIADLAEVANTHNATWSGVLEYEVAGPFGTWFLTEAVKLEAPPCESACRSWLLRSTTWFFTKEEPLERGRAVESALRAVH